MRRVTGMDHEAVGRSAGFSGGQQFVETRHAKEAVRHRRAAQIEDHPARLFQLAPQGEILAWRDAAGVAQIDSESSVVDPCVELLRRLIGLRRDRPGGRNRHDARRGVAERIEHHLDGRRVFVGALGRHDLGQRLDQGGVPVHVLVGEIGMEVAHRPPDLAKVRQPFDLILVRRRGPLCGRRPNGGQEKENTSDDCADSHATVLAAGTVFRETTRDNTVECPKFNSQRPELSPTSLLFADVHWPFVRPPVC